MNNRSIHFVQLGLSILVMSSSGALGKYISLPVPMIIWVRCVLGAFALFIFLKAKGSEVFIGWGREFRSVFISSILMGAHWLTYFMALKYANVAIGMLSLFTYPVITAMLEPVFLKTKLNWPALFLAMLAFGGVLVLVPSFDLKNDVTIGILIGLFSALLYSLRNILLKQNIAKRSGTVLMYNQLLIVSLVLWPVVFFIPMDTSLDIFFEEWQAILILGLYTTALGHTLLVRSFRHFSITTISIITCLTPLFGIAQGYVFLGEKLTGQVIIGGSIILLSVFVESIRSIRS